MRILVVDDQVTTGVALSRTLEAYGHETRLVTGAVAAWDALSRDDWRLILTDWVMPEIDGLELCRLIRSRSAVPYRYIIMLTVQVERWHKLEALRAGADDFLPKPVDEEELITRLAIAERVLEVQAELERKNARLAELANLDPLTGLANRRALKGMLEGFPSGEGRGLPYSIASLDIDHFKSYNDRFGHQAGDEALRIVAEILSAVIRPGDLAARSGGEEFVVVMPRTGPVRALAIAERLRRAIAEYPWPCREVTASIGVATAIGPLADCGHGAVLDAADRALYRSKRAGRNRVTMACLDAAEAV
jgi:two-component system, cell cycle response regulator